MRLEDLDHRARGTGWRQQRHLATQRGGAEAEQETFAVVGEVDHVPRLGQRAGQCLDPFQEPAQAEFTAATEHQHPRRVADRQRQPAARRTMLLDDRRHRLLTCPVRQALARLARG